MLTGENIFPHHHSVLSPMAVTLPTQHSLFSDFNPPDLLNVFSMLDLYLFLLLRFQIFGKAIPFQASRVHAFLRLLKKMADLVCLEGEPPYPPEPPDPPDSLELLVIAYHLQRFSDSDEFRPIFFDGFSISRAIVGVISCSWSLNLLNFTLHFHPLGPDPSLSLAARLLFFG